MEQTNELQIPIGDEEAVTLRPTIVKIMEVSIEEVGAKKSKKVICNCKHPDALDTIKISSVKYETKGKLETVGLWVNKDSKGLIRKGSALAVFLNFSDARSIEEVRGKEIATTTDSKGYLVFRGY